MYTRLDLTKLSLMDALDLATLIEVEAHERYVLFARQLGRRGGADPGSFFLEMAENEAKHGREIAKRRKELFGDTPATVTLDDLFDMEAPEVGAPRSTMSTAQAYEIGIAAEKKAFAFYDQSLPAITNPEIVELFTELREEEIEHVKMLRDAMAKLPPDAYVEDELDYDDSPFL
jgi:erythrin-vacuolar iron transport family protein